MENRRTLVVIPARLGSWRFPNKPLISICSMPMIEHVYRRSKLAKNIDGVVLAICDDEIAAAVRNFKADYVMTSKEHRTACDRVAEAAKLLGYTSSNDIVINVQGDEPVVPPPVIEMTRDLLIANKSSGCANMVESVIDLSELKNHHRIKVVLSQKKNLIYLTRQPIPATVFDIEKRTTFYRQTCVIGFRGDLLQEYTKLERTPLELIEGIDLLRLIENEMRVVSGVSGYTTHPVDIPEDVQRVEAALASDPWFKNRYEE